MRIRDNGTGGANPDRGTWLRALADRVEALGGKLEVASQSGHCTLLVARIWCDSDASRDRFATRSRAIQR